MTSGEIRAAFLTYFAERAHRVVPSSPLVPAEDPTLLFTNAGMNQFKGVFLGAERRDYVRAVSAQKCIRAGGKHNDLENVGHTARHLTFFEMLGNFSFGDYFKDEAIAYAWEFLTVSLGLPRGRLWVSVLDGDEEALALWKRIAGLPLDRIARLGPEDNFWSMGETGPCGPCSEIGIDQGEGAGCGRPTCAVGCDCDRYLELWNLVFMQYDRTEGGELRPLPRPSIDTGMGLERVASVLQGVPSNYGTDLLRPLIARVEEIAGRPYVDGPEGLSFRVAADHVRALTFALGDGVMPSNEGRGYVLRRILRRAGRHGRLLGLEGPFLHRLVHTVVETMGEAYPEVREKEGLIERVIRGEEERFGETLSQGLELFARVAQRVLAGGSTVIPGREAFILYDTYGFPLDLTEDMARERGLTVDREGFEAAMAEQRERAKRVREASTSGALLLRPGGGGEVGGTSASVLTVAATAFVGYEALEAETEVLLIAAARAPLEEALEGTEVWIDLSRTPFYAEAGGQVGDAGTLETAGAFCEVTDAQRAGEGRVVHRGRVVRGVLRRGDRGIARVDAARRRAVARSHTATHLLHAALRGQLGTHVQQAGSLVAPDRLRFDFTHYEAVPPSALEDIEGLVNEKILGDILVESFERTMEEARRLGALAFFGEKYGDVVRVIRIGHFSLELCGGTHTRATGEIGLLHLVGEGSAQAGVRRVEALTGAGAHTYLRAREGALEGISALLKAEPLAAGERIAEILGENKELRGEVRRLSLKGAAVRLDALVTSARAVEGIPVIAARIEAPDVDTLRAVADGLRERLGSGVGVLGAIVDGKVLFIATVTDDLIARRGLKAGEIVRAVSALAGGGGGGKPQMAQAGARDPSRLEAALEAVPRIVAEKLRG